MFEEQIKILKNFNIYDFIARIAGLCLEPNNQNVSFMLNDFIDEITEHDRCDYNGTAIMSDKKFRNIVESISAIDQLRWYIDPPENTFTQNVMLYGNYTVFNGIDHEPAYQLQLMMDSFCHHIKEYPEEFREQVLKISKAVLQISEFIYKECGKKTFTPETRRYLFVPSSDIVRKNARCISLSGIEVRRLLDDEDLFWNMLLCFGHEKSVDDQNRIIFSHPFMYHSETDTLIVLDVGLLPQFVIYSCIVLSEKAGIREQFIRDFNSEAFENVLTSFELLGHYVIDAENRFGLNLLHTGTYYDSLLSVGNGRLIYLSFLCDECDTYGPNTMHSLASIGIGDEETEKQLEKIKSISDKIGSDHVYHIVCMNSIGREMGYAVEAGKAISAYEVVSLTPHELWCLAINERGSRNFLPRYIRDKGLLKQTEVPELFSELDKIELYKRNQYSFYLSDEAPIDDYFPIFEPGDSVEYLKEAHRKADLHQVYGASPNFLAKVFLVDPVRDIYFSEILLDRVVQFIKVSDAEELRNGIWLVGDALNNDPERVEPIRTSLTFVAYWLSECRKCFNNVDPAQLPITILISVSGNSDDYLPFHEENQIKNVSEVVEIQHTADKNYNIKWTPALKDYLIWDDNKHEKKLIDYIIQFILSEEHVKVDIGSIIDNAFSNPLKRKMYFADASTNPCNRPLSDTQQVHLVNEQDEEYIHDITGPALVKAGKWHIGNLNGRDRVIALNDAVDYLYQQLTAMIAELNPVGLVELVYHDIEAILYQVLNLNNCFANEVRCYPEKEEELLEEYNKENKTIASAKFLLEYIAACPPSGTKVLDTLTYEYILAICSTILTYAHQSDSFQYGIYEGSIEILKSGRLGLDHEVIEKLVSTIGDQRKEEMDFYSANNVESIYSSWNHRQELTDAFSAEFGYTDEQFIVVVQALISIGKDDKDTEIHVWNRDELYKKVEQSFSEDAPIDHTTVVKIINDLSICSRRDFLKAPAGYDKWEVWPWRYDRRYSFTRRPIIQRGEEVIWGDRSLYRMLQYVFLSIQEGSIHVQSQQFNDLLGLIGNDRGKLFNEIVADIIRKMNQYEVQTNINKVNKVPVADTNGQELGDIDVLAIDRQNHVILPIEVKSFKQARNPYEICREHAALFEDTKKKKSYVTKHNRRVQWCVNHINDFIDAYKLDRDADWKVKGLFVVNHPQLSQYAYHENVTILTRAELSVENLLKIEMKVAES